MPRRKTQICQGKNVWTHWHQVILYSKVFLWAKSLHTMIETAAIVNKQTRSKKEGIVTMCRNGT